MANNHHTDEHQDGRLFAVLTLLLIGAAVGAFWREVLAWLV